MINTLHNLAQREWALPWTLIVCGLCFCAGSLFAARAESAYETIFKSSRASLKQKAPSWFCFLFALLFFAGRTFEHLPSLTYIFWSIAAAALWGVWRIDRRFLVIPDRLQLAGLLCGICFVLVLGFSGEDPASLLLERLLGMLIVSLLWFMSWIYFKVRSTVGFGFGDIKLLGWLCMFFGNGTADLIFTSLMIGILMLVFQTALQSWRARKLTLPQAQDASAFGPAIVIGVFTEGLNLYG